MSNQPQHVLIEACKKGNPLAQHQLFHKNVKQAYNTALRIMGNVHDAEDAVQDGFVKAFKYIKKYKAEAKFSTWLTRIIINAALDKLQLKKEEWLTLSADEERTPDTNSLQNDLQPKQWDMARINAHIKDLPKGSRVVFTLYLLEGYDQAEISEILNISLSTVKSQYQRARRLLQESLKADGYGK